MFHVKVIFVQTCGCSVWNIVHVILHMRQLFVVP